jgi:hypothetical protein
MGDLHEWMRMGGEGHGAPVYEVHWACECVLTEHSRVPLGTGAAGKLRLHCAKYRVPAVMKSFLDRSNRRYFGSPLLIDAILFL